MLPQEIITAVEDCGFFESIPLWAVTLIGGLFIWVLSFVMILSVYGRFFKMYMYTALAPVPLSAFAGEPTQNIGKSFLKSYASVCLEGAIIVLACIIFSVFASSPPVARSECSSGFYGVELHRRADFQHAHSGRRSEDGRPTCEGDDGYLSMAKRVLNQWRGYTVADCDCKYCLYYGGRKKGEVNCLAEECVCKEELQEALRRERNENGRSKSIERFGTIPSPCFSDCPSDSSFFLYWLLALRCFLYFVLKPYVGTETVSWMCILGAAPFAAMGFVNYNGMTAEQFVWTWLRSEMLEPKQIKFEPVNIYYEALKDAIDEHEKEAYKRND